MSLRGLAGSARQLIDQRFKALYGRLIELMILRTDRRACLLEHLAELAESLVNALNECLSAAALRSRGTCAWRG